MKRGQTNYNPPMTQKKPGHLSQPELTPETIEFMLSKAGQEALAQLQQKDVSTAQTVPLLAELRRDHPPHIAGALLTMVRLRQRAMDKFPKGDQLFFTAEALEQATAFPIADARAAWIDRHAPPGPILDLGCGIGGDTLALARYRPVIAYETSSTRLQLAQANAAILNLADRIEFCHADWTTALSAGTLPTAAAAFVDPARRVDGRRVFSLHQMQPPLSALLQLQAQVPNLAVKVAPGVNEAEIPDNCHVMFVSHARTCKEAVLCFGLVRGDSTRRWALVYDGARWHRIDASLQPPPTGLIQVGQYLHEPDPAVIRAGSFVELCEMLSAHLFDEQIAYLVGNRPSAGTPAAPFVQTFRLTEILPASLKQLNRRLQAHRIGSVELKKRGSPVEPESLRPRLKLTPGGGDAVVILTRQGDRRLMLLAHRV